ncbi:hypothetical protein KAR63_06085 [Weissella uvarum]|nr:hypothetical protein [Weissella uvarum]
MGNGFDINSKLKTSYDNYFDSIKKEGGTII